MDRFRVLYAAQAKSKKRRVYQEGVLTVQKWKDDGNGAAVVVKASLEDDGGERVGAFRGFAGSREELETEDVDLGYHGSMWIMSAGVEVVIGSRSLDMAGGPSSRLAAPAPAGMVGGARFGLFSAGTEEVEVGGVEPHGGGAMASSSSGGTSEPPPKRRLLLKRTRQEAVAPPKSSLGNSLSADGGGPRSSISSASGNSSTGQSSTTTSPPKTYRRLILGRRPGVVNSSGVAAAPAGPAGSSSAAIGFSSSTWFSSTNSTTGFPNTTGFPAAPLNSTSTTGAPSGTRLPLSFANKRRLALAGAASKENDDLVLDPFLADKLRPHQCLAVRWLCGVLFGAKLVLSTDDEVGLAEAEEPPHDHPSTSQEGALLADDMGLGKTLSTLAFVYTLLGNRRAKKICIACPAALTENWRKECKKWFGDLLQPTVLRPGGGSAAAKQKARFGRVGGGGAPPPTLVPNNDDDHDDAAPPLSKKAKTSSKKKILTTGTQHSEQNTALAAFAHGRTIRDRVLIISYDLLRAHSAYLAPFFDLLVLDEGHRLCHDNSLTTRTLSHHFKGKKKLLLSGTPLQNNLEEFFSLCEDFLHVGLDRADFLPEILCSREPNATKSQKKRGDERFLALQEASKKFMLRRTFVGTGTGGLLRIGRRFQVGVRPVS